MEANNFLANVSGIDLGWTGSHAIGMVLLVGKSGTDYIPVCVSSSGAIITQSI